PSAQARPLGQPLPEKRRLLPAGRGRGARHVLSRAMPENRRGLRSAGRAGPRAVVGGLSVAAGTGQVDRALYRGAPGRAGGEWGEEAAGDVPGVRRRLHRDAGGNWRPRPRTVSRRRWRGTAPGALPERPRGLGGGAGRAVSPGAHGTLRLAYGRVGGGLMIFITRRGGVFQAWRSASWRFSSATSASSWRTRSEASTSTLTSFWMPMK